MAGRQASNNITRYAGLQVQTSALGVNIPVGWGTFRCKCNLVDYLDFKSKAQQASTGKGGGSTTTGYSYSATVILALCEGQIDAVTTVYVDSKVYTNGSKTALAQAGLSLSTGAVGQAVWSYLTSSHPSHAIGYSGLAICYASNYNLGSSAQTPNHSFEVVRTSSYGVGSTKDADPSLVISDFFTNTRYGVPSWRSGLLGSLTQYQNYCLAAALLISPVIDSQRSASDFLTEILRATNSTCVWSEGLLKFIPYGDASLTGNGKTYTPNNTVVYALNDDNFVPASKDEDPVLVDIMDQSDAYNVIQLEYLDRTNQYNMAIALASDAANVAQYGMRRKDPDTVHCICDPNVAAISAQLYLQRTLYIRAQYKFTLSWAFALLEPGDIVEITDDGLGLSSYPVRIIQIDEDEEGNYAITAEDFPIGVANSPLYTMQPGVGYQVNQGADPGGVEANLLLNSDNISQPGWGFFNLSYALHGASDQYGLGTANPLVPVPGSGQSNLAANASGATSTTLSATTLVDSPAGSLIVVWAAVSTGTINGVSDSAGNSYTAGTAKSTSDGKTLRPFYKLNAAHLSAGGTITVTCGTAASNKYLSASTTQSLTALDVSGAGTSGSSTSPSISTGTLAQAGEVVFGATLVSGGNADAFTESAGFFTLTGAGIGAADFLHSGGANAGSTASVTYHPALGTSRNWASNVLSFKAVATQHYVYQSIAAFAGSSYTFSVCLQANAYNACQIQISDFVANSVYANIDLSAGAVHDAGVLSGNAVFVSANVRASLVSGIWVCTITAQFPTSTLIYGVVLASDNSFNTSFIGLSNGAVNMSQPQIWQGVDDGRTYAATTSAPAAPVIFNPPSVLNSAGNSAWAAVAGGPNWGGAYVWVSVDGGSNYSRIGTIDAAARYGVATANYGSHADPDSADTLSLDLGASGAALTSAASAAADNGGTLCLLDQELICFSTATLTNPSRYDLSAYIRRGYLNSTVAAHVTGATFVRLDSAIFEYPYYATNVGQVLYTKFQSFNLWGQAPVELSDCIAYPFVPGAVGATAPGGSAWTATAISLANAGQAVPAIEIFGAADNPSATGVVFYYRVTGTGPWVSAGLHPVTTTVYNITSVASGQTYDVGVAYQVNGVVGAVTVVATGLVVGSYPGSANYSPGSTIISTSAAGAGNITCPSGSYGNISIALTGADGGDAEYFVGGLGGPVAQITGGQGGKAVKKVAAVPGTTTVIWNLGTAGTTGFFNGQAGNGTASTVTTPALTANGGKGGNFTSGAPGAGGAATGGDTNTTGGTGAGARSNGSITITCLA